MSTKNRQLYAQEPQRADAALNAGYVIINASGPMRGKSRQQNNKHNQKFEKKPRELFITRGTLRIEAKLWIERSPCWRQTMTLWTAQLDTGFYRQH